MVRAGYVWRRIRQSLQSKRDQAEFDAAQAELLRLHKKEQQGKLIVCYLDESGFSLQPVVPYGWQRSDSQISCTSNSHHRRLNVIGLLQCNGTFDSYTVEGTITTDVVIACIEQFIERLRESEPDLPVVIVLDNARIHKGEIEEHRRRWQKQKVRLKYLPTYSPELNMIEILWRRIKYQWLPLEATESWEALVAAVEHILKNIGSEYQITFT